jgi:hypothetical protein
VDLLATALRIDGEDMDAFWWLARRRGAAGSDRLGSAAAIASAVVGAGPESTPTGDVRQAILAEVIAGIQQVLTNALTGWTSSGEAGPVGLRPVELVGAVPNGRAVPVTWPAWRAARPWADAAVAGSLDEQAEYLRFTLRRALVALERMRDGRVFYCVDARPVTWTLHAVECRTKSTSLPPRRGPERCRNTRSPMGGTVDLLFCRKR